MWRWMGLGREEGGEGRQGSETGGAWVGTGLGREDGGERDGRRTGGTKHHCRLLRVSAQVERSMGGGSAAPRFAEACWEVSGAVLRG